MLSEVVSSRRKRFPEGPGPALCFATLCDVCSAEVVSVCAVAIFFLMPVCWFVLKSFKCMTIAMQNYATLHAVEWKGQPLTVVFPLLMFSCLLNFMISKRDVWFL